MSISVDYAVYIAVRDERDHWIRLFNRLDAAISHHRKSPHFKDRHDEALYAAADRILRDASKPVAT